jgi:hypothetical protein
MRSIPRQIERLLEAGIFASRRILAQPRGDATETRAGKANA